MERFFDTVFLTLDKASLNLTLSIAQSLCQILVGLPRDVLFFERPPFTIYVYNFERLTQHDFCYVPCD